MSYGELQTKKEQQLTKEIRVGSDYHADALKRSNRTLFNEAAIRRDITDINEVLAEKDLNIDAEERARLEMVKGRNLSSLLILDEKTTGDSREMKAIKKSAAAIEGKLNETRRARITEKNVDEMLTLYDKAILACRDYLKDKDPSYSKGQERYQKVTMIMYRLHQEAEAFIAAKELIRTGVLDGRVENARELLVQAKVYGIGNPAGAPEGEEERRRKPTEDMLKRAGREAGILYQAFSGKETPSDLIARLSKSKSKTERKYAKELPALFANIRSSLSEFKEGKVAAKVFLFGNDVLSVYQNAFGQLTLRAGGQSIPLERNTGTMADMLARDIVKNENVYGKKAADGVIRDAAGQADVSMEKTANRQILTDYLSKQTGYPATAFSNFYTNDLAYMVRNVLQGKRIVIVKDGEAQREFSDNELVFAEEGKRLINVAESRELLKKTLAEENRERVKSQVTMQRKEAVQEQPKQEAKQEEKKEEKQEEEWSEKEEKVKNLLGDVVFSYETWIADEQLKVPGERLRLMLEKNSEALAYLISDMFVTGELNYKLVNGMLDKMPLFMMGKEEVEKFRQSVTDSLKKSADAIKKELDDRILEKIGDRPEGFFKGLAYDGVKLLAQGAAYAHLVSPASLLKGIEIKGADGKTIIKVDGLKEIIHNLDDETVQKLGNAENDIDAGVEAVSQTIQENVKSFAGELFKGAQNEAEEELPNPYERGIEEDEKKKRLKNRIKKGNEKLNKMTKDSVQSGDSGLGLFTKLVFEQYFKGVDTMDKRSMMASMIKNAKPVGKLLDEDDKALDVNDPALSTEELVSRLSENNIDPKEHAEVTEEITRRIKQKERRSAELKRRREYNEKVKTEAMANYIGGMLKGAGPLFQKMMQGLPTAGLPKELEGAIEDMKSKLAPIPEEIVEAELNNIVEGSHNQIKNINVVKPLGAASVAQTFLCKITRSDKTEEETAIKLLKPDVRNRMLREKQLMINCARLTDITQRQKDNEERIRQGKKPLPELREDEKGGMQVTYEGQLERIEEELDFTIEARNVELGKIYDKNVEEGDDKVVSMKLNTLIQPTTNSMVLEKAPGETIDSLLKRIKAESQAVRDIYRKDAEMFKHLSAEERKINEDDMKVHPYFSNPMDMESRLNIEIYSKEWDKIQPGVLQEKLMEKLAELKKKKEYLDTFAKKWTVEGMFGEGFYHGDPHEGNIMVDDEKLTVIDFGNCTKLSDDQKLQITRMLAAASIGDMDTFRHGFHMLLKPEFEELYQQKRTELGNKLQEVFSMGDKKATGARIAVALLEAQKLGLEVPSAVYNFSQGQMRLQNAIDHFNEQIEDTQKQAEFFMDLIKDEDLFDFTDDTMTEDVSDTYNLKSAADAYTKDMLQYTDSREELKEFALEQTQAMHAASIGKMEYGLKNIDKAIKDYREIAEGADAMLGTQQGAMLPGLLEECLNDAKDIIPPSVKEEAAASIRGEKTDKAKIQKVIQKLTEAKEEARKTVNAFRAMSEKKEEILSRHNQDWKPTEEEQTEFDTLRDRFLDSYAPAHRNAVYNDPKFRNRFRNLTDQKKREKVRLNIDSFFRRYPQGREEFMEKYNDFLKAQDEKLEESDPSAFLEKQDALRASYLSVMQQRLKEKQKTYNDGLRDCSKDFLEIMSDIIDEYKFTLGKRLGFFKSLSFKHALDDMEKQERYLNS